MNTARQDDHGDKDGVGVGSWGMDWGSGQIVGRQVAGALGAEEASQEGVNVPHFDPRHTRAIVD